MWRIGNHLEKMSKKKQNIPFAMPDISKREIKLVTKSLKSGWLTSGPVTRKFENSFREISQSKYALAVNSATSGLHLALEAIGIKRGDLVIVPSMTFTATAEVVRYMGADPIMCDVEASTLNIDPSEIKEILLENKKKLSKIKAIIVVHYAGVICNLKEIKKIADEYKLKIVEDAAHTLPYQFQKVEKYRKNNIAVYSFYATKAMTTGEGGMITTNSKKIADRISLMRLHGINRDSWNRQGNTKSWSYDIVAPGFKYNLSDVLSSIGVIQLERARKMQMKRKIIAQKYINFFENYDSINVLHKDYGLNHSWYLFVILLPAKKREQFFEKMRLKGIQCSVHFIPLYHMSYWKKRYKLRKSNFSVCEKNFQKIISLPIYSKLSNDQREYILSSMKEILKKLDIR